LAGQVAMTTSVANPRLDFEINALGTLNILEAARCLAPETVVVYSSSNKVYGELAGLRYREAETRYELVDYPDGIDESFQLDGYSHYGCSKLSADQYVRDYCRMFGLRTVVFRHSSVFGSRQFATVDQGWIGWFCQKAIEIGLGSSELLQISGDGKQVRDVLDVQDAANAYIAAVKNIEKSAGRVFNIGGGYQNSLSLRELFSKLEIKAGRLIGYIQGPWRTGDQRVFISNNAAATETFGWTPKIQASDGIREAFEWAHTPLYHAK
jgi:CDP-paratose 2-epimerase